jgi:hypothetical protein
MNTPSMKEIALKLSANGWYVFPLGVKSKVTDATLAPHSHQSASNDVTQIERWWTASPNANIGIDLGRSNLSVLDFDKGEPPAGLSLPETVMVKTSRGTHVYFAGTSKQGDMYFNGLHVGEVKSAGGYVLAPFSAHPSGAVYTVASAAGTEVVNMPSDLLAKLAAPREPVDASINGAPIPRGQHDTQLYRIACKLRHIGLEEEGIYNHLVEVCVKRCENYGTDYLDMCRKKAQQACKHDPGIDRNLDLNQRPDASLVQQTTTPDVTNWRDQFHSVGEMDDRPVDEIIKGALQEGVCFIGASPGDGKTLTALAFAKAICTGEPLFGLPQFSVAKPRAVIYLIPETRDPAFRKRCTDFQIPNDKTKFMARTISMGTPLGLEDPCLLQAVRETNAVVFLDTAARFMKSNDENSAAQNKMLVDDVIALGATGAVCVVLIHHATKASQQEAMTLENMLRGTSDLAAMCDQAYGIRKDRVLYANGDGPMEIELVSLKDREQIGELTTLRLAASRVAPNRSLFPTVSIIHETGNFKVVSKAETFQRDFDHLMSLIQRDPKIPMKELVRQSGLSEYKVELNLKNLGWHRVRGGKGGTSPWHQDGPNPCPFAKDDTQVQPDNTVAPIPSKQRRPGTKEAIAMLSDFLAGTDPEGDYVEAPEVYEEAGQLGISDSVLEKARKALGVVIGKDGGWSLPASANTETTAELTATG